MSIKQIAIPKKKRLKLQRPLNILSLDFDYFLKFENDDTSVLSEFPDGTEAFLQYNDIVWANRLATKEVEDKIKTVKCNEDEFAKVYVFLNDCKADIPVMIANSHVHIYDFILSHAKQGQDLRILNLDFHHDAYNTSQELNCGNWALKLKERTEILYHISGLLLKMVGVVQEAQFLVSYKKHIVSRRSKIICIGIKSTSQT